MRPCKLTAESDWYVSTRDKDDEDEWEVIHQGVEVVSVSRF